MNLRYVLELWTDSEAIAPRIVASSIGLVKILTLTHHLECSTTDCSMVTDAPPVIPTSPQR
jgi:hypothetical protein